MQDAGDGASTHQAFLLIIIVAAGERAIAVAAAEDLVYTCVAVDTNERRLKTARARARVSSAGAQPADRRLIGRSAVCHLRVRTSPIQIV